MSQETQALAFASRNFFPVQGSEKTYLEHLQILQPLLHQLLYPPRVLNAPVLPERIPRAALGVFPKVVGGELVSLAE